MATTTPPEAVRSELQGLTGEAAALVAAAAAEQAAASPEAVRGALFEAADVIAETYRQAAAELAAAWYDELRDAADLTADLAGAFIAEPVAVVDLDKLHTSVAVATTSLYELIQADIDRKAAEYEQQIADSIAVSVSKLQAELQKEIAGGFRDTITENTVRDDAAVGWRRHTRPSDSYADGCRWCRLLADKGAIYSKVTARFAAHKECHCLASPVFDGDDGPMASVMQYVASKRKRTKDENKTLRDYLDKKYGPEERDDRPAATEGGGRGGQPPVNQPASPGAADGPPDRSDQQAWDAYWERRKAVLPASYNAADMLPPLEVEFAERMHRLDEQIEWISQANSNDRLDPATGKLLPVHDFRWQRFATDDEPAGTEWEHKGLEPSTPVDPVHIARQITKATRKGKTRVVVDVGDRTLPDGTVEELRSYNLRPERPSATAVWVMSQGELHEVELLTAPAEM
ncbi:hypothetical protein KVF89_22415 [Nocardioides carbamazepini]|uniref:VG15 protein n=1 Tax=Nocardioides carbamazepini TaxID=2854259 RepID=UPI00214A6F74|nr:hypothetical protein [Nocardioides carbamazepini]MCR1785311.1 hypothetical protein [Nocardioides carbamazepini]